MEKPVVISSPNAEIIQKLVLDGDLSKMDQNQKVTYYKQFCESLGLNPLTQPFQLLNFQGKQRLYATKDCTEQLRKLHGVSIVELTTQELRGVFVVTAKAQDKNGKTDASTGAVQIEGLKGDALANALMKAETKAKRRVTLSICGMGILDEAEIETMPGAATAAITETALIEDVKPELIPGHWYAKLEKCKTKEDVDALAITNKETLQANPDLKLLFGQRKAQLHPAVIDEINSGENKLPF